MSIKIAHRKFDIHRFEANRIDGKIVNPIRRFLYLEGKEFVSFVEGYSINEGHVSKEADHLHIHPGPSAEGIFPERTYVTDAVVDLTPYNTLCVKYSGVFTGYDGGSHLVISTVKMNNYATSTRRTNIKTDFGSVTGGTVRPGILQIDISGLSTSEYIRIHAWGTHIPASYVDGKIYGIWFE